MTFRVLALTALFLVTFSSAACAGINTTDAGLQKNLRANTKSFVVSQKSLQLVSVNTGVFHK